MKKIINGRIYDTNTAKELGKDDQTYGNFSDWEETLYRKSTGEYFLHGEGGPQTKYAQPIGENSWTGGEKIIPLSIESAKKWVEEHLEADDYERIFGVIEENDGKKTTVSIRLSDVAITRLNNLAAKNKISKSEVIENLILGH
ncbi:ribbon-helix-helix domain-containing protein [Bilifractor porci]|uniref:Ribbon-helix-helix protein, CopG family n=1 Tax=Bilifractor porci TaxID=2606636 RepID=A0A7X2P872_9FIRM|nr:CopG family transcriptional regulator [Bilifractor porci]MST81561.1 ribbon-helix-helix protein, CopG family [Bilifractor porci]